VGAVQLIDVTLRDGLQAEAKAIPTDKKIELFERLVPFGFSRLEITSFAHPKWIPQLADSEAFCKSIFAGGKEYDTELMAFVPNVKGLDRLLQYPISWASAFISTSETFNTKNVNCSIKENLSIIKALIEKAHGSSRKMRIYVSTLFGCPYEGAVDVEKALGVLKAVADYGPDEIALSDTIGVGTPDQVESLVGQFRDHYSVGKMAMHFHNTYGLALASAEKAFQLGVTRKGRNGAPHNTLSLL